MGDSKIILITGASGFLGSNLVRACLKAGYVVMAYKRRTTNLWRLDDIVHHIQWFDVEELEEPFLKSKINYVIHTATLYGKNIERMSDIVFANLLFPLKLYELAARFCVDAFFNTDTVLHGGLNSYALSKSQFEQWFRFLSCGVKKQVNIKLEHLYGPMDDSSKFISYVIDQCISGVPEIKLTLGEQELDFIHVDDAVNAYICLLNNIKQLQEGYNEFSLGGGMTVSIRQVVNLIAELTNTKSKLLFGSLPYRKNETMRSVADISKLRKFGWFPKYCLKDGIRTCIKDRK